MVFVVGVGWQYGPGASGVPWGWVSWGVRRWGCHLGLDGVLVTLDAVSLAAACGAAGDACAGGRRLPSLAAVLFRSWSGGGVWGSGGALPPGWGLRLGLGGLGPGWCAAGSMGWCMRLGPALVWGSSMHRCLRRGGSNRGGVNGPYLGVLLSYVVWELTG